MDIILDGDYCMDIRRIGDRVKVLVVSILLVILLFLLTHDIVVYFSLCIVLRPFRHSVAINLVVQQELVSSPLRWSLVKFSYHAGRSSTWKCHTNTTKWKF